MKPKLVKASERRRPTAASIIAKRAQAKTIASEKLGVAVDLSPVEQRALDVSGEAVKPTREQVQEALEKALPTAVETIGEVLTSKGVSAQTRSTTAFKLLDRTGFGPMTKKRVEHLHFGPNELREMVESVRRQGMEPPMDVPVEVTG